MDRWITDTTPRTRFRYYTRANADEVGPEPISPLGWSLAWVRGTGPGAADGFVNFGIVTAEELAPDHQIFANWGSYFYNNMSLSRLMGVRMPGGDVAAIDRAYFGDHPDVPPYVPDPSDESQERTEHLGRTLMWIMSTDRCEPMEEGVALSRKVRADRPDFAALSDRQLVDHARRVVADIRTVWGAYCEVVLGAAIGPGAVAAVCDSIGRSGDAVKLFAGLGGVESAGGSMALWSLSRRVRASGELTAAFEAGLEDLLSRLQQSASPDAEGFLAALDDTLGEYGHRGPHEWDLRSECWATRPGLVLGMVDQIRHRGDEHDPSAVAAHAASERRRVAAEIADQIAGDAATLATFEAGLRSGALFYQLREAGKSAVIRLYCEAKLALFALADRMVERDVLDSRLQLFMLLDDELEPFVADPPSFSGVLRERADQFLGFAELEPPWIVDTLVGPPPVSEWPRRGTGDAKRAEAGEVLQGAAAAPGRATGRARIVVDPSSAELEPGDVLVCRTTDPSWAPLFLAVGAVVCDVGAIGSHAAIVAREIGVPCAVSVTDATRRIPEGATISVDGSTGEVTVEALA